MVEISPEELSPEAFADWLLAHSSETVGQRGRCFAHPLARWLSERSGRLIGVDSAAGTYGPALVSTRRWQPLPAWAVRFAAKVECPYCELLSGEQAFSLLIESL
jgi:hypothetical protein